MTVQQQLRQLLRPVTVQNVTSNDRLNGVFVTATNSDVTPITTGFKCRC
jgi:hypothetical protein